LVLGQSYREMKKPKEAIRTLEAARQLVGFSPLNLVYLSGAYAQAGQMSEAQKCLDELQEWAQKTYVPAFAFAIVNFNLGKMDAHFDWLEKAFDEPNPILLLFPAYLLHIPSHPRYHALLRKTNLEP
jgi:tetratricopeptide (TPR) repeat protein